MTLFFEDYVKKVTSEGLTLPLSSEVVCYEI